MTEHFKPQRLMAIESFSAAPWLVSAGIQQGPHHYDNAVPLQDAYDYGARGGNIWLIAADGISEATLSHHGSAAAVRAVRLFLGEALANNRKPSSSLLIDAFGHAHEATRKAARELKVDIRELSTTLCCVLLTPTDVYAASVGDSSIMAWCETQGPGAPVRRLVPLCSAVRAAPPATDSITEGQWRQLVVVNDKPVDDIIACVITTDGGENIFKMDGRADFMPTHLQWMVDNLEGLENAQSLSGSGVRRGGAPLLFGNLIASFFFNIPPVNDDDRTILLAFRAPPQHAPPTAQPRSLQ